MTIILAFASILSLGGPLAAGVQAPPTPPRAADSATRLDSAIVASDSAAGADSAVTVSFLPERPVQGSAVVIRLAADSTVATRIVRLTAELAGEPLHFEPDSAGAFRALAGIPIDVTGTLRFPIVLERANGTVDTVRAELPVGAGEYAMERLTVAPRFGSPPDSALARRMAEESARARAVSQRSHQTPRLWDGPFVQPREARITSGFGHGRQFNGRVQSRHMGVDFAGAVGTPVRAPARGVVALVDQFYLGGNVVYIDHGAGLVTAYLHLSRQEVAVGDTVEPGQIIGRVGATGRVTGPHLHWIARYGGITINPLSLVGLPAPSGREDER